MDSNLDAFFGVLDPQDNQTGGGTASAIAGAMAASLVGMVARLSMGKKDSPRNEAYYQEIDREAQALSEQLFGGARADAEAFDAVMTAIRQPKATEAEKAARRRALQTALEGATRVPLRNAERLARTLELCGQLKGHANPNVESDLECAWHLGQAGFKGCLSNVAINLSSLQDEETRSALETQAETLMAQVQALGEIF